MVMAGRVAWVAEKTPGNPEDHAWNVGRGGRFDNVRWGEWNVDVVNEALKAASLTGLFYCGVDVMLGVGGVPYVVEVNSAPSQTSPYRISCTAKVLRFHAELDNWDNLPLAHLADHWKFFGHPAIVHGD